MDKTITLLLQLSLIIPFAMVIVAALVEFRILKGNVRWPVFIGVFLTSATALGSLFFFSSTIQSQSYSQTLIRWLSLSRVPESNLQIGVLFDPLSLSFYLLISVASLFYVLLDYFVARTPASRSDNTYSPLLFLLCFFATMGIVLSTNFLQLLLFWFMLSMSMNLLHEVNLDSDTPPEKQYRHWWGWNAFSDGMLLLAIFLIGTNFESFDFLSCFSPDAIREVQAKNTTALPGIGAALFFAALPRLGLFPASMLIIGNQSPWRTSSLAVLNLLAIPAGLFLLLRFAPFFLSIPSHQRLLFQLGTVSALLTVFSAVTLARGLHTDRFLCWFSATMAGVATAMLGMNASHTLHLILSMILLQNCVIAVLIPLRIRLQSGSLPAQSLASIKICILLLMISILVSLGNLLNPLITARAAATDFRSELLVWLIPLIVAGYVFGAARFYLSLFDRFESATPPQHFSVLPLWAITIFVSLVSASLYIPVPFIQQLWPGLMTDLHENPFDRDWFFCNLYCLTILVALILAWMTSRENNPDKPTEQTRSALIQLGQSHYYALTILKRTLIGPLHLFAKIVSLLDEWLLIRFSRASLEKTPEYWGNLLRQMQNGQITFQSLVLLFTLSILIFVLMVLQV
ncbi:hypothetical protein [uncultured Gimesia sp.]|uniref:hypothetical protein n=1 Tax=uncultured Gimesia sp. TaxID=1678688 RepID=UPI0026090301|nr:hypothetical protein [uncultured Gimesia sp.]